jgi:hypothetical protein
MQRGLGICDRCGFQFKHHTLREQMVKQRPSGLLVCRDCLDIDHEQLMVGTKPIVDKQTLRNARPDTGAAASRELTGTYDSATHNL